ncbi:response regulator [Devosia sp. A449]
MDDLLSGRRVLVVEDEMLVLLMIEDMLADLGCESVTAAATIDKALASIEEYVFDAAMLDMNLNGDDSAKVAVALAARGVPFVYCTGNNSHGMQADLANTPVLRKPFSFEELTAILTRLLSR